MNVYDRSWKAITPRTRLLIGGGVIVYAVVMESLSDVAEKKFDLVPTEDDMRRLENAIPKFRAVKRKEEQGEDS